MYTCLLLEFSKQQMETNSGLLSGNKKRKRSRDGEKPMEDTCEQSQVKT